MNRREFAKKMVFGGLAAVSVAPLIPEIAAAETEGCYVISSYELIQPDISVEVLKVLEENDSILDFMLDIGREKFFVTGEYKWNVQERPHNIL